MMDGKPNKANPINVFEAQKIDQKMNQKNSIENG